MPFLENFSPEKYGLSENMWCLIKGFSELIQYAGRIKSCPLNCRQNREGTKPVFLQVAEDSLKFPILFGKLLSLFFIFFYTSQR